MKKTEIKKAEIVTNVVTNEKENDTNNNVVTNNEKENDAAIKKQMAKEKKLQRENEIKDFLNNNNDIKINFVSKDEKNKDVVKKLNGNKKDVKDAMKKEFASFDNCKENTLHLLNTLVQRNEIKLLITLKEVKYLFNNKDFKGLCSPTKTGKYTSNILIDTLYLIYKIKVIR